MGKDGSGAGAASSVRAVKPPPDRLYGRARGHKLRPRQALLLNVVLPRLALPDTLPAGPLWLEIGFGGGEHALAQVRAHPEATLIACEVFENGICSLLSALVPEDGIPEGGITEGGEADAKLPPNLYLWTDDARVLLRRLPDACLNRLFLMFPDPWPKMRHAKRRFVHPEQLALLARVLKPGAEWRVASDDPTYQAWVHDVMAAQTLFDVTEPATTRPEGWPPTRYEAKALRAGRQPLYWAFRRRDGRHPAP